MGTSDEARVEPQGDPPANRYLIVRRWRSLDVAEDYVERMRATGAPDTVRWDHTHVSQDDAGRLTSFCVYEAPSAEDLRAHIVPLGGFDLVGIHPIRTELAPDRLDAPSHGAVVTGQAADRTY